MNSFHSFLVNSVAMIIIGLMLSLFGCSEKTQKSVSCNEIVCENPPPPHCDGRVVVTYSQEGECINGDCDYTAIRTTCPDSHICVDGECIPSDESCNGVVCNDPPADYCDENTLVHHQTPGTCEMNGGPTCTYPFSTMDCGWDSECVESIDGAACKDLPVLGTQYYVAQSASGSGDGSSYANRMSVASHNSTTFAPGDLVNICGPEDITSRIIVPSSGTSDKPIIYRMYKTKPTVIRVTSKHNAMSMSEQSHIWIDGLVFRDGWQAISVGSSSHVRITRNDIQDFGIPQDPPGGGGKGIFIGHSSHITVGGAPGYGNFVKGTGVDKSGGDVAVGRSDNIIISYNLLLGNPGSSQPGTDGIVFQNSSHALIEYNTLADHFAPYPAGEDGLDLKGASNVLVRYNIAYNNSYASYKINSAAGTRVVACDTIIVRHNLGYDTDRHAGISISGGDTGADGSEEDHSDIYVFGNVIHSSYSARPLSNASRGDNINIYNNLFYHDRSDTDKDWAAVLTRSSNIRFKNNILVSPLTRRMLYTQRLGEGFTLNNNLYFSTQGGPQVRIDEAWIDASLADSAALIGDPLFVDEEAYNFRLTENSPAIDSGVVLADSSSEPPTIYVQGAFESEPTGYASSYAYVLHPDTDFFAGWVDGAPSAGSHPVIVLAKQDDFGSAWEVGPFVYP